MPNFSSIANYSGAVAEKPSGGGVTPLGRREFIIHSVWQVLLKYLNFVCCTDAVFLFQEFIRAKLRMKLKNERSKRKSQTAESTTPRQAGTSKRLFESIGLKNYDPVYKIRRLDEVESLYKLKNDDALNPAEKQALKEVTLSERRRLIIGTKAHVVDCVAENFSWLCEENEVRLPRCAIRYIVRQQRFFLFIRYFVCAIVFGRLYYLDQPREKTVCGIL